MSRRIVFFIYGLACATSTLSLSADEFVAPLRPYDGIQAGFDAHRIGEARRLDAIDRQLGWNQLFRWQAATQTPSSIYYDPYIPEFDYAFRLGPSGVGFGGWAPSALDFRPIWGYGYFEAVRQPIGQRQVQTGPNRWESFPIYGDEDGPAVIEPAVEVAPVEPAAPAPPSSPAPRGRVFDERCS